MKRTSLGFLVVLWSLRGFAETAVSVLGVESEGLPDALTQAISDGIRSRAEACGWKLIPGGDLVEMKLVFCVGEEGAGCLARAGKSLGAQKLIYGQMTARQGEVLVRLSFLDVEKGIVERTVEESMPKLDATVERLVEFGQRWALELAGRSGAGGALRLNVQPAGAQVYVDGRSVGVAGTWPLMVDAVEPGQRVLEAKLLGHAPWLEMVFVKAGETVKIDVLLQASRAALAPLPTSTPPATALGTRVRPSENAQSWRLAGWIGFGTTVALGATALWAGLSIGEIEKEKEHAILESRAQLAADRPGYVNADVGDDACLEAEREGATSVTDACDRGKSRAMLTNVLIGATAGTAAATGFFFWKGYISVATTGDGTSLSVAGQF